MPKWNHRKEQEKLSDSRKALYYGGFAISAAGLLLFLSTFLLIGSAGSQTEPPEMSTFTIRGLGGVLLIALGGILRKVGARGVAGSGLVLDPERARRDVEPWSRMAGGMVKDGLDGAGIELGSQPGPAPKEDFADRLRKLKALHDEGVLTDAEYAAEKREALDAN